MTGGECVIEIYCSLSPSVSYAATFLPEEGKQPSVQIRVIRGHHSFSSFAVKLTLYQATANNHISVVEHHGLAR